MSDSGWYPPHGQNPYEHLYIYYLKGRMDADWQPQGSGFIGVWEEGDSSFLFFTRPAMEIVTQLVAQNSPLRLLDHFYMRYDQWQGQKSGPLHIAGFCISPPWHPARAAEDEIPLQLDPGVVFGTGTHPTTHDCLEALRQAFGEEPIASALDLGTGTGLLALAAARLGCRYTVAVDLNRLAARTAQRNVCLNQLQQGILVLCADAVKSMDFTCELVVSNIHYEVIQTMLRQESFLTKKRFILSGLLRSQARQIEHLLAALPVKVIRHWQKDGIWHTYYGRVISAHL
jgi:ribosomal protein L11 methyltransferase